MYTIDLAELRAEMEVEREWREREMRTFRNQVAALQSEEERKVARKALVVMLYAHFEGVSKALLTMYVNRVNALDLRVSHASPSLGAASIAELFASLRDGNRKCREFARDFPDDTKLHRFAAEREFVDVAWRFAARPVQIDAEAIVDTESNLKPKVLRKILFRLGLDPDTVLPWEATVGELLNRRNDVAHGTARDGITQDVYAALERAVYGVVDGIVAAITEALAERHYLGNIGVTGDSAFMCREP